MKYRFILIIALGLLASGWSMAQARPEPEKIFKEANQAYENKNYGKSIALYEQLLQDNYRSAALLYNLGMACLEQQQLGRAVLYLERAHLLKPGDEDIRHNLQLIKAQYLEDQLDVIPESFLVRWWKNAFQSLSSGAWTILSLIFIWLAMAGLSIWRIGKTRKVRKWGFFLGLTLLLFSILFGNLANSRYSFEYDNGRAVVMARTADFRVAPDTESETILVLHEGTSCKVLSELNSWYKVKLPDGQVGWIDKERLRLI